MFTPETIHLKLTERLDAAFGKSGQSMKLADLRNDLYLARLVRTHFGLTEHATHDLFMSLDFTRATVADLQHRLIDLLCPGQSLFGAVPSGQLPVVSLNSEL